MGVFRSNRFGVMGGNLKLCWGHSTTKISGHREFREKKIDACNFGTSFPSYIIKSVIIWILKKIRSSIFWCNSKKNSDPVELCLSKQNLTCNLIPRPEASFPLNKCSEKNFPLLFSMSFFKRQNIHLFSRILWSFCWLKIPLRYLFKFSCLVWDPIYILNREKNSWNQISRENKWKSKAIKLLLGSMES